MRRVIYTLLMLIVPMSLNAMLTSEPISVIKRNGKTALDIYLHEDGGTYYISDSNTSEKRGTIALLPGASEVLGDNVEKAWYDKDKIVVYVTKDGKLSAIYPVYSICSLTRQQLEIPQTHKYVGIHPNPEYRIPSVPFHNFGNPSNCFVYTKGKAYKAEPAPAELSKKLTDE